MSPGFSRPSSTVGMRLDKPQGEVKRQISSREKVSTDDQGRFFSYLNRSSSLIFSWPLSLVYVPNTQEQGIF